LAQVRNSSLQQLNDLAIHLHAGQHRGRSQGGDDRISAEKGWIHHRHPGQANLQQCAQIGAMAAGTHHDLRAGIQQPDLEGRLKVDRAVGTQQQNGTSSLSTGLAQHVG
jgi:hypothetical protein